MFYRMTRLHFEEERLGDLLAFAETLRGRVQAIDGQRFADIAKTEGAGELKEPKLDSTGEEPSPGKFDPHSCHDGSNQNAGDRKPHGRTREWLELAVAEANGCLRQGSRRR